MSKKSADDLTTMMQAHLPEIGSQQTSKPAVEALDASTHRELVVIIRPSFMLFCQDGCRAAVFNLMLYMIAERTQGQPQENVQTGKIAWDAKAEEITESLSNVWSLNKVRKEVNILIEQSFIGKRQNLDLKTDRTKHFFFGLDEGKKFRDTCDQHGICVAHRIDFSSKVLHLLEQTNAINECCCFITSPDKLLHYAVTQAEINPEKERARLNTHLEDARKAGLDATLTLDEWLVTLKDFNYHCAYCSGAYELLEHFVPVVLGGGTTKGNCVPSCYKCNAKKNAYHPFLIPASVGFSREAIARVGDYCKGVEKRVHE